MRLIDKDALMEEVGVAEDCKDCRRRGLFGCGEDSSFSYACDCITDAPTIEPPTTTWLGNYCPYKCENCGHYTDSKTPFCAWCGRRASNYEG